MSKQKSGKQGKKPTKEQETVLTKADFLKALDKTIQPVQTQKTVKGKRKTSE
jgi:hypothetical protein